MLMFPSKEGFQLWFIEANPEQEESTPDHPQCVEEDAGQGGGLDLGEHANEGDIEEHPNGGGKQPRRELTTRTQHQAGHLDADYQKVKVESWVKKLKVNFNKKFECFIKGNTNQASKSSNGRKYVGQNCAPGKNA